jgi:two-component system, NarL family, sensor kinase
MLALFLGAIFLFIFQFRKRKIQHESEKKILSLNSIIQGQEIERNRMAKDLHDGLGGMLSGIKLNLSAMKGDVIIQHQDALLFTKSIEQLDSAITEMRRIAHNMMPEALIKFGLNEAIQDFCESMNEHKGVQLKYTQLGLFNPLEKPTELILYRIIQELCNNAIKHANASFILIQLSKHEHVVTLVVEDNGKGFDRNQPTNKKGSGLNNVQSRVDYLNGILTLESEVGKGTTATIEIKI